MAPAIYASAGMLSDEVVSCWLPNTSHMPLFKVTLGSKVGRDIFRSVEARRVCVCAPPNSQSTAMAPIRHHKITDAEQQDGMV